MPTPQMKAFAKEAHKKPKTVEKLWKKSEKIVKKRYEIDEENDRFYPLVVGTLKHLLGIEEKIDEDGEGDSGESGITTTDMGDYVYPTRLGAPVTRMITSGPIPVETEIKKTKKRKIKNGQQYDKLIRTIVSNVNNEGLTLDDAMSDMILYFCERDSVDPIEDSIQALNKFFGVVPSIFDDMK